MSDFSQVFIDLLHCLPFHFSWHVFPDVFSGPRHVCAVFYVVDVISVRRPSACVVVIFSFPLDNYSRSPSAWSLLEVVVDVKHSVSAIQGFAWVDF